MTVSVLARELMDEPKKNTPRIGFKPRKRK